MSGDTSEQRVPIGVRVHLRVWRVNSRAAVQRSFAVIFFCTLLSGCFSSRHTSLADALVQRLKNRGPVTLSNDNPFLAGNLLLNREMENSAELQGFIQHRGVPKALEVEQEILGTLTMRFYYPDRRQEFALEELEDTWVIRGPRPIPIDKLRQLSELTRGVQDVDNSATLAEPRELAPPSASLATAPPAGRPERTSSSRRSSPPAALVTTPLAVPAVTGAPSAVRVPSAAPSFEGRRNQSEQNHSEPTQIEMPPSRDSLPSPAESSRRAGFSSPAIPHLEERPDEERGTAGSPSASLHGLRARADDQQFLTDLVATLHPPLAEITPRGDLVHYVSFPGETLGVIARWYTFDRDNALKLARINGLSERPVSIGDSIVIPTYLLRNKGRLTEQALQALLTR